MDAATIYQRFVDKAPAALLIHGLIQSCLSPEFLDDTAKPHLPPSPRPRQLAFSHLVQVLLPVVFQTYNSVRQSYRQAPSLHAVATIKCVYERLAGTPPATVASLIRAVVDRINPLLDPLVPGRTRFLTLDGNHLAATQNRLAELAGLPPALPGQALILRDQATGVFLRVLPHEDGHDNERSLHAHLVDWFREGDIVIADSAFCTHSFMAEVQRQKAGFVVRRHGGVGLTPVDCRRDCGRVATGRVYQTYVKYARTDLVVRLVEVELDQPTREGERTIGVLSDVAEDVLSAVDVAGKYCQRRTIESAFQELAEGLRGEVDTLAYPRAALLAFGLAVVVYNLLQVVRRACQRQTAEKAPELSPVLLAQEVDSFAAGLEVSLGGNPEVPTKNWDVSRLRAWVDGLAARLVGRRYAKSPRGHRKQPKPTSTKASSHVATARILEQRRQKRQ